MPYNSNGCLCPLQLTFRSGVITSFSSAESATIGLIVEPGEYKPETVLFNNGFNTEIKPSACRHGPNASSGYEVHACFVLCVFYFSAVRIGFVLGCQCFVFTGSAAYDVPKIRC